MLEQFFAAISDFIHDNWMKVLTGFVLMALGWFFGKRKARSDWRKREFFHRLNVSLNLLIPGEPLQIRTLLEKKCEDVFLNVVATDAVAAAARHTTATNPLLPLPQADYWQYLNAVLNEISEQYSIGEIRRDLGLPVTRGKYLICLTCECAGEMRTRKVRAMVIQKKHLENLPAVQPKLEHASHVTRWETLKILAEQYKKNPWQFIELELSVV
jgi:hypothetical protein